MYPPLGEGAFGVVWKDRSMHPHYSTYSVAVKTIPLSNYTSGDCDKVGDHERLPEVQPAALTEARISKFLSDEAYMANMDVPVLRMFKLAIFLVALVQSSFQTGCKSWKISVKVLYLK